MRVLLIAIAALWNASPASASIVWTWQYSASGIAAGGTFQTVDTPDASGGYLITSIAGTRNGETITSLQAPGTAIPGNEPFLVDDLIFPGPGPQMTSGGFGFGTSGGNFSNPFYAGFLPTPGYLEFFSMPPFTPGPDTSEVPIVFSATPVPEPAIGLLLLVALMLFLLHARGSALLRRLRQPAGI